MPGVVLLVLNEYIYNKPNSSQLDLRGAVLSVVHLEQAKSFSTRLTWICINCYSFRTSQMLLNNVWSSIKCCSFSSAGIRSDLRDGAVLVPQRLAEQPRPRAAAGGGDYVIITIGNLHFKSVKIHFPFDLSKLPKIKEKSCKFSV